MKVRRPVFSRFRTAAEYARLGLRLGSDLRSKLLLGSMLPRLRWAPSIVRSPERTFSANVHFGGTARTVYFRAADVFVFRDVYEDDGYLLPAIEEAPIRTIVDLGAHIGLAALRFKERFPTATIQCVEPDPDSFELLQRNMSGLPGIRLHSCGIGEREGEATLVVNREAHASSSFQPRRLFGNERRVLRPVRTLDAVLGEAGCTVDLVKFDIEGNEEAILAKSARVQEVPFVVGEVKGTEEEAWRLARVLAGHRPTVRALGRNMFLVFLSRERSR